jgi:hypothetical protein
MVHCSKFTLSNEKFWSRRSFLVGLSSFREEDVENMLSIVGHSAKFLFSGWTRFVVVTGTPATRQSNSEIK